jgi:2,4-dienoyl-CoA reductase-like NADH-dependent reductase (Old Yellow Enzyme family)
MSPALFNPIRLRNLEVANRIVVSPMCQYSAEDGTASEWHLIHLNTLAMSGAGLLFVEATAVEAVGRITPGCLGLYSDANEQALAPVIASVRRHSNAAVGIQLGHAGRKASSRAPWDGGTLILSQDAGWQTVAPSAVAQGADEPAPRALEKSEIARIVERFVDSTRRADRLGFDAIELHGAHGYLMHEFLSPIANRRDDEYGGPLENRMRFPLQVFDAVRAAWPDTKPLGVRLSCTDWVEGGWEIEQSVVFARALKARGCDWIDCSGGGVSSQQKIPLGPGYQVPFAERIRQETGIPTIAVGLITDPHQAEEIIASGKADMVALARGMLYDPRWGWHAAAALGGTVQAPKQYWRSVPRDVAKSFANTTTGQR